MRPLPSTLASLCLSTLAALAVFAAARAAHAQDGRAGAGASAFGAGASYTEQRVDSGTAVVFPEDHASGSTLGDIGAMIRIQHSAVRMGLVRPRLNFVSEMLKSVEAL